MQSLKRGAVLIVISTVAMVGLAPWSQADESKSMERFEDVEQAVQSEQWTEAVVAYEWGVAGWNEVVQVAVDAFIASIPPPPPPVRVTTGAAPSAAPSGATGECGGATNGADQFIQRESGGNPNAYNPSGAWGCYQIMPGTWAGAGCNDLGSYGSASASAQAACASRLSLSAWN